MKIRTILSIAATLMAAQGVTANAVIDFCCKNISAEKTFVALPSGKVSGRMVNGNTEGESKGCLRFEISGSYTGFCTLNVANTAKLLYIEDETTLVVTYNRDGSHSSPYHFKGGCANENAYLTLHEQLRTMLPPTIAKGNDASSALADSLESVAMRVNAQVNLSSSFRKLETSRQQYAMLNTFYRRMGWDDCSLPDVTSYMTEDETLWMTPAYRSFFLDALYAVGRRNGGESVLDYTLAELRYVADRMKLAVLRDAVMEHVMNMYMSQRGADDSDRLMQVFLSAVGSQSVRERITRSHDAWDKVRRGRSIPDFSFLDIDGKRVCLSDFRGKYVFIDCWATWCGPCKAQLPHLARLEERYAKSNIVFVSLSSDKNRDTWAKMIRERNMEGIQLNEPNVDAEFFKLFQVNAIPRFILLSPDGTVYDSHLLRPSDPQLREQLDRLLL